MRSKYVFLLVFLYILDDILAIVAAKNCEKIRKTVNFSANYRQKLSSYQKQLKEKNRQWVLHHELTTHCSKTVTFKCFLYQTNREFGLNFEHIDNQGVFRHGLTTSLNRLRFQKQKSLLLRR